MPSETDAIRAAFDETKQFYRGDTNAESADFRGLPSGIRTVCIYIAHTKPYLSVRESKPCVHRRGIWKHGEPEMSAQLKTRTVNLRIDPEAHELIVRAAQICGKSITAFMTEASIHSAQEELLEQRFIGVSADVFEALSDKLSAPGVARDQLVKLFESSFEWMD